MTTLKKTPNAKKNSLFATRRRFWDCDYLFGGIYESGLPSMIFITLGAWTGFTKSF